VNDASRARASPEAVLANGEVVRTWKRTLFARPTRWYAVTGEQLSRTGVLAYRALAHDLEHPAATPADCGVLEVGVQDTPPGTTARRALEVRLASPHDEDPTLSRGLALVHSLRGAMHVHRAGDLGLLTAALRPDDPGEGDAVDQVAEAMRR